MKPVTTLPDIEIISRGIPLPARVMQFLDALVVIQKLSRPTVCEITFTSDTPILSGPAELLPGSDLWVRISGNLFYLFSGTISAVEYHYGPDNRVQTTVRGYDPLYLLSKHQNIFTYTQASCADIARELTTPHQIPIESDSALPIWERLVQYNETNLHFLARMAQRSGHYFFFRKDAMHIAPLTTDKAMATLLQGDTLLECTVGANSATAVNSVYTSGWDPFRGQLHEGTADASDAGCSVRFSFPDAARTHAGDRKLVDIDVQTSQEAAVVSQAEMDRCTADCITVSGVARGNPRLHPGACTHVDGIATAFCGHYCLTEVTHIINAHYGYISKFDTRLPDFRRADTGISTTFGTVTDINDPEQSGRVKVALDAYSDTESDWMHVVLPASGQEKGIVMLPDTGDRVVVLCMNNTPARGVVLGGIATEPGSNHGWGLHDGKAKTYAFISPSGQKIALNDTDKTVTLENKEGSAIILGPHTLTVHAKTNLVIEAPGNTITISGKQINFEKNG